VLRPGDHVLFRFVWPWKVFSAMPTTVVALDGHRTVLGLASDTPVKWPPGRRVPIPALAEGRWTHVDARWYGTRLIITEAGDAHSVYVMWGPDGEFLGWYVNLEEPWRESPLGFDTTDHLLDIWIDPNKSWCWKDEDHLTEAVDVGLFTPEKAREIRTEGERVIERVEAWASPFDESWENWTPNPDWRLPQVPDGWGRLT
jgi:Protein of unknown function (DUF402)